MPDVKYLQFGRELNLLADSLKRLEKIVENADLQHPHRPWHKDASHAGPNTLQEVTGDFLQTLSECQKLLDDNSKFHRSSANFIDNVVWWSETEREVNSLRDRVHFHVTKVTLISKPFETQLLLGIRRELKSLRRDVADIRGLLIQDVHQDEETPSQAAAPALPVPEELSLRFTDALYINKPKGFDVLDHLPLKEGFDALVFAFANSTVEFNPGPGLGQNYPEEVQYLSLIKSRWIVKKLEDSYHFRATGTDSLWADYMRELKDDIREQFLRFDAGQLATPPADAVYRLPESCFSTWVVEEDLLHPPDLAEQRPFEEKILELSLPSSYSNRQCALTIFRKSDIELRLVSTTKDELNKDFHREESMDVNMNFTRLIPTYASPDEASKPTNNLLLCTNQQQNQKWFSLKESVDVRRLQQALTGYRVFHDMQISWSIEGSSNPHKSGRGRLQLWHYKPLPKMPVDREATNLQFRDQSVTSVESPPPGTLKMQRKSTTLSSATFVSCGSSATSPVKGSRNDGVALLRPESPALIILAMSENRYTFLHIQRKQQCRDSSSWEISSNVETVDRSICLKPDLCLCGNPRKICRRVVLGSTSKTLDIRRHRAKEEKQTGLYSWDIAKFRFPRHLEYKNLELLGKKYICLDFDSVSGESRLDTGSNALAD